MRIDCKQAADFLRENDCYYILTHASPDGDTIGSGFGLCAVLRKMGKKANVYCSDPLPRRYDYMYKEYSEQVFEPQHIVAVDVADTKLLGKKLLHYADKIELCIDHHISNTDYAEMTLVEPSAAAACQVVWELCESERLCDFDKNIASCLYTGIATDTGCFKFDCCTPETHIAAASLMRFGIDAAKINRRMFDEKSRARISVEQFVIGNTEYLFNDRCAIACVSLEEIEKTGLPADEFEGMAALTTILETVEVGVFIRQKEENKIKVSMRSTGDINVSALCSKFGGGGHVKAAGCTFLTDIPDAKAKITEAVREILGAKV